MKNQKSCKCRFLIAWISGSDSNCGEENGIRNQNDLIENADKGIVDIFKFDIPKNIEEYAWNIGSSYAFSANFTAHDSVSVVQKMDNGHWVTIK